MLVFLLVTACSDGPARDVVVIVPSAERPRDAVPADRRADPFAALGTESPMPTKGVSSGARRGAPPPELAIPVLGVEAGDLEDNYGVPRGPSRRHEGIDIWAPRGTAILAAVDGWVWGMKWNRRGGRILYLLDSSFEYVLMYAHLDGYADGLEVGQAVRRGEVLGYVGTTGNVRGSPHLHLRVGRIHSPDRWWDDVPLNPYPLLVRSVE